ncbi:MAG: polysaccharide biosynthesis/export family protein [Deltaproteobacteria bacterium]|nr:polysaccharide biosynthesis/export family protein [Deltaproteobacteria bacterium]
MKFFLNALCLILCFSVIPIFSQETVSDQEQPTLPDDYTIGLEDVLRIDVWKEPDLSVQEVMVRPDGKISIPLVSDIQASGLTPVQLKKRIEEELKEFVSSPTVTVVVLKIGSRYVSIVGQVAKPGVYYLGSPMTVLELLARAGGCLEYADKDEIVIVRKSRNGTRHFEFNYKDVAKGKNLQQNIVLENGDVVVVP